MTPRHIWPLQATCNVIIAVLLFTGAWLCDDAFITYRTVDNLTSGHGLTWNAGERVQAFTHPLWLFLVAGAHMLTDEIYYTAILLSWVLSCAVSVVLTCRVASSWQGVVLGTALLAGSKAFVDYSSSGLENPLTHLLLILFVWIYPRASTSPRLTFLAALLAGLATLNRMDALLLFLPSLLSILWQRRSLATTTRVVMGFAPFLGWQLFALIYYGFLFPNTAYAKLGTGIPAGELITQGFYYLLNSLKSDPLTLATLSTASVLVLSRRCWHLLALVLGAFLYSAYTVTIGGDFMSGRFFSAPYLLAVAIIVRSGVIDDLRAWYAAMAVAIALILAAPHQHLMSGRNYGDGRDDLVDSHLIADERATYFPATGLLNALYSTGDQPFPKGGWADWGRKLRKKTDAGNPAVVSWPHVGFFGYYAGPDNRFVDIFGLGDPLTARLPMRRDEPWRIGHFRRILPEGYPETHIYGLNLIADRDLAQYYEALKLVVSGDLFSARRWREIYRLNTGAYDALIDRGAYTHPDRDVADSTNRFTMQVPISFVPDSFGHDLGLGSIYYERRQYERAIDHFRKALKFTLPYVEAVYPNDHEEKWRQLHLHLSRALVAIGESTLARRTLDTYVKDRPDDEGIRLELERLDSP